MYISDKIANPRAPKRCNFVLRQDPTEFEIQAFLYNELRNMGYCVRGEIPTRKMKARFDLIIIHPGSRVPQRIIEVKNRSRSSDADTISGRQIHRYYEEFGVPTDMVGGMKEAIKYLGLVKALVVPHGQNARQVKT